MPKNQLYSSETSGNLIALAKEKTLSPTGLQGMCDVMDSRLYYTYLTIELLVSIIEIGTFTMPGQNITIIRRVEPTFVSNTGHKEVIYTVRLAHMYSDFSFD